MTVLVERIQSAAPGLLGRHVLMIAATAPTASDRRLWQEAATLREAGMRVTIVCPQAPGQEARGGEIGGVRIQPYGPPASAGGAWAFAKGKLGARWREIALVWRVFLTQGFDALHFSHPSRFVFLVALPFKLLGVKIVIEPHDARPASFEAKLDRPGLVWRFRRLCERLTFRLADVAIAPNESGRDIALAGGGKRREDVFVVRSGPDLARLRPVAPDLRWKRGRPYLIGYVGAMREQGGLDLLLAAMAHLVFRLGRKDVTLALASEGPPPPALLAQALSLGLEDHVTFHGRIAERDLSEMLSSADLCVSPVRVDSMNEIMDYMAFGKPIVQFDLREGRASAGLASLYARANDAQDFALKIADLIADPHRRAAMGAYARARVEGKLSWRAQAQELVAAYERALGLRG